MNQIQIILQILTINYFLTLVGNAQINEATKLPEMIAVSPKTFEFLKYADIPVTKYNGVPNISVPLFTIEDKAVDIPITLNYNSNGFKVEEEAGSTGLGWGISTSWSIVQIVNGFDDYGSLRNIAMPNFAPIIDDQCDGDVTCYAPGVTVVADCNTFIVGLDGGPGPENNVALFGGVTPAEHLVMGQKDYQPDIFSFNLPGFSGKFVMDWENNTYLCLTDNKIKIVPVLTGSSQVPLYFSIHMPDGNVFKFELKEQTTINLNYTQNQDGPNSVNSLSPDIAGTTTARVYQLTQIATNKSDFISLEYEVTAPIKNFPSVSKARTEYQTTYGHPFPSELSNVTTSYTYTQQTYSYLKRITFTNGYVDFDYSDRIDIVGAKKLDRIRLFSVIQGLQNIKEFKFAYNYFVGHTLGTNTDSYVDNATVVTKSPEEFTHRLKLISLTEVGSKSHVFEYDPEQLPKKTSLAKDYWGMYNGYLTNNTSFIDVYKFNIARENEKYYDCRDNINSSSLQHARAGLLNKITYPTGGYAIFDYELNSFTNVKIPTASQGSLVTFTLRTIPNPYPDLQKAMFIEGGNTIFNVSGLLSTQGCGMADTEAYSRTYFKIRHFNKDLIHYIKNNATLSSHLNSYGLLYVLSVDLDFLDDTPSNPTLYNSFNDMQDLYLRKTINDPLDEMHSNKKFNLKEGIVVFTVSGGCGTYSPTQNGNWSQSNFTVSYKNYLPLTEPISYGAGVRIKNIQTFSDIGTLASHKKFIYEGGKLMSRLNYFNTVFIPQYTWKDDTVGPDGTFYTCIGKKVILNSNNFTPPSLSASGKYVGYDSVEEYNVNITTSLSTTTNGNIKEYYVNNSNAGVAAQGLIVELCIPEYPTQIDNGLVFKREIRNDNNYLVKEYNYVYGFKKVSCVHGVKVVTYRTDYFALNNMFGIYKRFWVAAYPIRVTFTSMIASREVDYSTSGNLTTISEYVYNDYNQMIYSKTKDSHGQDVETRYQYPKDFASNSQNTVALMMANKNVLSPIISKKIFRNTELISNEEYQYALRASANTNLFLPDIFALEYYKSAKGSNLLENKIRYSYDNNLNVIETIKDNFHTSYIWAYNNRYLVAKIENTSYSNLNPTLITSIKTASLNTTLTALPTALYTLRTALPESMMTSYTYIPLVGINSITEPTGNITYYNYDTMGRLKSVKDNDGNLLSENKYHYKN